MVGSLDTKGKGEMIFADALYFVGLENFQEYVATLEGVKAREKTLKFIFLSLVYGINDYAFSLIKLGTDNHIFNNKEAAFFGELLSSLKNKVVTYKGLRGVSRMVRLLAHMQKSLNRFSGTNWASSDLEIGNVIDS